MEVQPVYRSGLHGVLCYCSRVVDYNYSNSKSLFLLSFLGHKSPSLQNGILFSNMSERMRKRETLADKGLECITREWDVQQGELEEMALAQSLQRQWGPCSNHTTLDCSQFTFQPNVFQADFLHFVIFCYIQEF